MGKIDLETAPKGQGTRYPPPHDAPCRQRRWLRVGDAAGLTQFGVNLVTLDPGVWSSQRHWHEKEDELRPGDCAGFKAGVRDGHCLQNRSDKPACFLVVGGRDEGDWGEYSDIDMKFLPSRYSGGGYTRKNGDPL